MASFLTLLTYLAIIAASHNDDNWCLFDEMMEYGLSTNTETGRSLQELDTIWQSEQRELSITSGDIMIIPIQFNVLLRYPISIPDEILIWQIERLNDEFSAANPGDSDYDKIPSEFLSVRSRDTQIRFVFAGRKNKVTPIQYWDKSAILDISFTKPSEGGMSIYRSDKYLNFYLVELEGDIKGATGCCDNRSMVAISSKTFTSSMIKEHKGRTAVHEIGHWLCLKHTWGHSHLPQDCVANTDHVSDTPPQKGPNKECPGWPFYECPRSCSNNAYTQDMCMNFMDYTPGACKYMFTDGQKQRMWECMRRFRPRFLPKVYTRRADVEYVNWIYFRRFDEDEEPIDTDTICYGNDALFYENNINEGSGSNILIYGCYIKSANLDVFHLTDIRIIYGDDTECNEEEGYQRLTQDLNEGNNGGSIWMCYKQEEASEDDEGNMAILDVAIVEDGESSRFDMDDDWTVNEMDNVNPNGMSLHIAVRKGEYFQSKEDEASSQAQTRNYLFLFAVLLSIIVIGIMFWRSRGKRKRFFGSTLPELKSLNIETKESESTELSKLRI